MGGGRAVGRSVWRSARGPNTHAPRHIIIVTFDDDDDEGESHRHGEGRGRGGDHRPLGREMGVGGVKNDH